MKSNRLVYVSLLAAALSLNCINSAPAQRVQLGVHRALKGESASIFMNGGRATTDAPNDDYHETSIENLSRLYWALGMLDEKNDVAIEQFLFINDCDLFNQFSQNGEQWPQIKSTARDMICKRKGEFPTRFEVLMPVSIGAPDQTGKQYAITSITPLTEMKQLEVAENAGMEICGSTDDMKLYPRSLLLNLAAPITITSVLATPEVNEFVTAQKNMGKTPTAMLRLKVRIGKYIDTQKVNGSWHAVATAAVDGYEFYNGADETKLLFAQDLPRASLGERAERVKKAKAEQQTQDNQLKNASLNDLYSADKAPEENDYSAGEANNPDDPCARGALPF